MPIQKQARWAFFDPVNPDIELNQPAPIVGQQSISVAYQDIGEPGTRRIVRLTAPADNALSPCSDAIDEVVFTVPE